MSEVQVLGSATCVVMDQATQRVSKGSNMSNQEEPLLASPPTQEIAVHVRDYERFTRLLKIGAITCFIIGIFVLLILK